MDAVVSLLRQVALQALRLETCAYALADGAPRFDGTLVEHAMSFHVARSFGYICIGR